MAPRRIASYFNSLMLPSCSGSQRHGKALCDLRMRDVQTEIHAYKPWKVDAHLEVRPLAQGIFIYMLDMAQHINRQNGW